MLACTHVVVEVECLCNALLVEDLGRCNRDEESAQSNAGRHHCCGLVSQEQATGLSQVEQAAPNSAETMNSSSRQPVKHYGRILHVIRAVYCIRYRYYRIYILLYSTTRVAS